MFYFKFNSAGIQEEMRFFEEDPQDGWIAYDGEIEGNIFKLVDGKPVPMEQEEKESYFNRLLETSILASMRQERNKRLVESDWTQLGLGNLTDEKRAEWEVYRQALRDMFVGVVDFTKIEFPKAPN